MGVAGVAMGVAGVPLNAGGAAVGAAGVELGVEEIITRVGEVEGGDWDRDVKDHENKKRKTNSTLVLVFIDFMIQSSD
jgi:hypothetical protein